MVFNSLQYAAFFPAVLLLYWRLSHRAQTVLIVVASYVFYGAWDWRFLGLMMLTTVVDYAVGLGLAATRDDRRRKLLFATSVALNLGVLGFFKYFNFFVDSAVDLLGQAGVQANRPTLEVLLPIGISFYTFHGISYTFDVFRRDIPECRSFLTFAAFVAFFPQLVAGPIGRAEVQLPQFKNPRTRPSAGQVQSALFLILLGLFKKIVVADSIAPYVDDVFGTPGQETALTLVLGAWAFALQIYGDFSGYTDIARGSSRLMGIELLVNFRQPYFSRNVTEFWRTWHISLSSWLRDYLYIPLGGSRGSLLFTQRNLMITMVLAGLWHGAAWTFVIWGALHGLYQAVYRMLPSRGPVAGSPVRWRDAAAIFATFNLVCLGWIFFRAQSPGDAFAYLRGIVTLRPGPPDLELLALFLPLALAMFAIDLMQRNQQEETALLRLPSPAFGAVVGAGVVALLIFTGAQSEPFIYFQF